MSGICPPPPPAFWKIKIKKKEIYQILIIRLFIFSVIIFLYPGYSREVSKRVLKGHELGILNSYGNMVKTLMLLLLVVMSYNSSEFEYIPLHAFSRLCLFMHKSGVKYVLGARII
jgi:hypothetical protein